MPLMGQLAGHKSLYPGNHHHCWYGHGQRAIRMERDTWTPGSTRSARGHLLATCDDRRQHPPGLQTFDPTAV